MLIELPVGKYFAQFLADQAEASAVSGAEEARSRLSEMPLALLENSIMKLYLEDFYFWSQGVPGETAAQMRALLGARADAITINVTYNSLGTMYNNVSARPAPKRTLSHVTRPRHPSPGRPPSGRAAARPCTQPLASCTPRGLWSWRKWTQRMPSR